MNISFEYYKTNINEFIIASYNNQLCMLDYRYRKNRDTIDNRIKKLLKANFVQESTPVIEECKQQLTEYFNHQRKSFDIPLLLLGTPFQKEVWNALIQIPYGQTSSYLQLSKNINKEKAVRAVANANGANAISIIVPCHRIIGSNGQLTGYAGGLETKEALLQLEQGQ